jgi:hypothetical protein
VVTERKAQVRPICSILEKRSHVQNAGQAQVKPGLLRSASLKNLAAGVRVEVKIIQ